MGDFTLLRDAALAYARAGVPIFPCQPDDKKPACMHGFKDATTDLDQIKFWWQENSNYNIAFCPGDMGLLVFDPEFDQVDEWRRTYPDLPPTKVVRTPRGGEHHYYETLEQYGSAVKKKDAEDFFDKVDRRGTGGYVLLPPSVVGGKPYVCISDLVPAPLPEVLAYRLAARSRDRATHTAGRPEPLVRPDHRAREFVASTVVRGDVAISGSGGNARTFALAASLRDLGLSEPAACDLIAAEWNPHCIPPWDDHDLEAIVRNAYTYSHNDLGVWAIPTDTVAKQAALPAVQALLTESKEQHSAEHERWWPKDDAAQDQTPDVTWIVPDILQKGSTCMIFGPTQSYKSFLALDLGMGVSTGRPAWGVECAEHGAVYYGALEARAGIMRRRRPAWRHARGVTGGSDFFVMPGPILGLSEMQTFVKYVKMHSVATKKPPRVIILDTVSKMLAVSDATKDAPGLILHCDQLLEVFPGCSVIAIHHTGKDESKGPRDSSAYRAGFDTVIEVQPAGKLKAIATVIKHKDTDEGQPFYFEGREIGGSLVFDRVDTLPVQPSEPDKKPDNDEDRLEIGRALQQLEAVGRDRAVSSQILAADLLPPHCPPDRRPEELERLVRRLQRRVKTTLAGYCTVEGRDYFWHLPEQPSSV